MPKKIVKDDNEMAQPVIVFLAFFLQYVLFCVFLDFDFDVTKKHQKKYKRLFGLGMTAPLHLMCCFCMYLQLVIRRKNARKEKKISEGNTSIGKAAAEYSDSEDEDEEDEEKEVEVQKDEVELKLLDKTQAKTIKKTIKMIKFTEERDLYFINRMLYLWPLWWCITLKFWADTDNIVPWSATLSWGFVWLGGFILEGFMANKLWWSSYKKMKKKTGLGVTIVTKQ